MVQQQLNQVTDSFGLADCQELLTFCLYSDQSKTSRRDSVKIYLEDQHGPATALFDCQSFTEYICLSRPRRSVFFCIWLKFVSYESYEKV